MKKRRGILTLLVFVVLLGLAGVLAAVLLVPRGLPDPEQATCEELIRWLVTHDLSREPMEKRLRLVHRLDREVGKLDFPAAKTRLSESRRGTLWNNILLLVEPWFMEQMDEYFRADPSQRTAYLDRMLDRLAAWRGVAAIRPACDPAPGPSSPAGILPVVLKEVERWKREADPDARGRIDQFLAAIEMRCFWRSLVGIRDWGPLGTGG